MKEQGLIIRSIGGLYSIESPSGILEVKARGVFRNRGISPAVGDMVEVENGAISKILERKNHIIRPAVSNLDQLIFVISTCQPNPNYKLLDQFIAVAIYKNIKPILLITKIDLQSCEKLRDIYSAVGIPVYVVDYQNPDCLEEIAHLFSSGISVLTGNSGAGKSTLLNAIEPSLDLKTSEISKKLGRGRHTTRETILYKMQAGGYLADTPGFSSFETEKYDHIRPSELAQCFPEFHEYLEGKCRFSDCTHRKEPGCCIREAVEQNLILPSRYESYCAMYEDALKIPEWELAKLEGKQ